MIGMTLRFYCIKIMGDKIFVPPQKNVKNKAVLVLI